MARLYFNTSALVKGYVQENGSAWVQTQLALKAGNTIYLAHVTIVEMTLAIVRRMKGGTLSSADAAASLNQFRTDLNLQFFRIGITSSIIDHAEKLAEKHALRAYDAVQLAALLDMQDQSRQQGIALLTLVSADVELNGAAGNEGIACEDPNSYR